MPTRVAINGFGRIGRQAFKIALGKPDLEVVAINDIGDVKNMAYLLKHDTVYRADDSEVAADGNGIVVDGKRYPVLAVKDPTQLPWKWSSSPPGSSPIVTRPRRTCKRVRSPS
jgi:glyceraldehyde 3-phosphate dehydrogenase